jgi:Tfp pilus assembly protein PilF
LHAQALLLKKDIAGATADVKRAISVAPDSPLGYARMGDLLYAQKDFDGANKFYIQAAQKDPNAFDALNGQVNVALAKKQPAQALKLVQDALPRAPNSAALYMLLGQVEVRNQDSAKAEDAYQKAFDIDPKNTNAALLLAALQSARGSDDQAIATYQKAIAANPGDARIYVGLGVSLEKKGDWQQAEEQYKKALGIQPDYGLAANNLSYLLLEHGGDLSVASSLAQTARKGMPDSPNSADTLGWAYYKQGVYNGAIDMFQQAIAESKSSGGDNPTYHYHLGLAYEKTNKRDLAKKELEYALKLNPSSTEADQVKQALSELGG